LYDPFKSDYYNNIFKIELQRKTVFFFKIFSSMLTFTL